MEENSGGAAYGEMNQVLSVNNVDPETLQEIAAKSIGTYVVVEFLVGTQNLVRKEGILTAVGTSWLVLYDESDDSSTLCDMYAVKFITYYAPGFRPARTGGNLQSAQRQVNAQRRNCGRG